MKSIKLVLTAFSESFSLIRIIGLKKYYFIPGILGAFLFILMMVGANFISGGLLNYLENIFNISEYHSIISIILKIIIWIVVASIYFLVYKSVLLVILSPFMGYISEKVDNYLTGKEYDFSFNDNMRFIWRGIQIGIKSFIKQLIGMFIIMLCSFLFPINLSIPLLMFLLQGYFTGFSFIDYTLERYNFTPEESLKFLKKQRFYSLWIGSIFTILFLIPFIGIFIVPLVTCVAATKVTLELLKEEANS